VGRGYREKKKWHSMWTARRGDRVGTEGRPDYYVGGMGGKKGSGWEGNHPPRHVMTARGYRKVALGGTGGREEKGHG